MWNSTGQGNVWCVQRLQLDKADKVEVVGRRVSAVDTV